jgi:PAS domain S-box-containing protein
MRGPIAHHVECALTWGMWVDLRRYAAPLINRQPIHIAQMFVPRSHCTAPVQPTGSSPVALTFGTEATKIPRRLHGCANLGSGTEDKRDHIPQMSNIMTPGARVAARLETLIKDSPIASVISNPRLKDNPIVACNAAFMELTGYDEASILGRNCRFLAGPATEPWLTEAIRGGVRKHNPVLVEILNYKCNGTPFRNAVLVAPIFDEEGELEFFLGSQVEIEADTPGPNSSRRMAATLKVKSLTARQRQVLEQMATGHLNKQIAFNLGLSEQTVKMHRALLLQRLGVATTADAIRIAVEAGL